MTEDDLVARLRDHARDESRDDALWERLSTGEATAAELADLERRAASEPEVAAMLEAARPLGADAADRIAGRLASRAAAGGAVIAIGTRKAGPSASDRVLRRAATAAVPLALAAALVLYVTSSRDDAGLVLPEYAISAVGESAMRGPAEPAARLRLGEGAASTFEIVLRPTTAVTEPLVAYVFAVGEGEPSPVDAEVHVAGTGAVRVKGAASALGAARELRVVVGPAQAIGRYEGALARAAQGTSDAAVRVLTVAIVRD
jgi:hypothetical protein